MRQGPQAEDVPETSLLAESVAAVPGSYGDCFAMDIPGAVGLTDYVAAFYCTPLFRAERLVLRLTGARASDADARAVAEGRSERFAVWQVVGRREDQMLLRDKSGRTASWFAVSAGGDGTMLRFGSAVFAVPGRRGKPTLGPVFQSLIGAHQVYSRALLASAAARLRRIQAGRD